MTQEAYCSFEVAKLLKEKGFDEKTLSYYEDNVLCHGDWFEWNRSPLGHISAPTLQMACKWLREVHHLLIVIDYECENCYVSDMYSMSEFDECGEHKHYPPTFVNCKTYEEACEAACLYALKNLI